MPNCKTCMHLRLKPKLAVGVCYEYPAATAEPIELDLGIIHVFRACSRYKPKPMEIQVAERLVGFWEKF